MLIVDDSLIFRQAARALLERRGYDVVGEASTAVAALALAEELRPAAALVDVALPDRTGYELAAELRRRRPRLAVLLTSADESSAHSLAEACGARGFVPKSHLARCDLNQFWPHS